MATCCIKPWLPHIATTCHNPNLTVDWLKQIWIASKEHQKRLITFSYLKTNLENHSVDPKERLSRVGPLEPCLPLSIYHFLRCGGYPAPGAQSFQWIRDHWRGERSSWKHFCMHCKVLHQLQVPNPCRSKLLVQPVMCRIRDQEKRNWDLHSPWWSCWTRIHWCSRRSRFSTSYCSSSPPNCQLILCEPQESCLVRAHGALVGWGSSKFFPQKKSETTRTQKTWLEKAREPFKKNWIYLEPALWLVSLQAGMFSHNGSIQVSSWLEYHPWTFCNFGPYLSRLFILA